ncbi:nucleotidyltransferase domain-containing protein [Mediterraneibacter massiliensis]|uniref:nucleotidyltransferase domain-containing protein n=1 Tax=Mediterraneibacter massiliensis TaxID=1720300 RepID=UPI000E4DF6D6|nr:nucleotidyltransferase domain-containing protein [Mediterraneibacter massiliensis]RGT71724.1 nucleotidyltransferase domain-containing protein [Ruminococcus sp. AF18-22]
MGFQIYEWLEMYAEAVDRTFGYRVWFLGVQGSYARGEGTQDSDIDVVLVLDKLLAADLRIYRNMLDELPYREKTCGFISGRQELENWTKADLFQFCHDTVPLKGSLENILSAVTENDIREAVHMGACNIYHGACHNIVHERQKEITQSLYKSAVFVLQAKYFLESQVYISKRAELFVKLSGKDREILYIAMQMKKELDGQRGTLDEADQKLIDWASDIIYKMNNMKINKS